MNDRIEKLESQKSRMGKRIENLINEKRSLMGTISSLKTQLASSTHHLGQEKALLESRVEELKRLLVLQTDGLGIEKMEGVNRGKEWERRLTKTKDELKLEGEKRVEVVDKLKKTIEENMKSFILEEQTLNKDLKATQIENRTLELELDKLVDHRAKETQENTRQIAELKEAIGLLKTTSDVDRRRRDQKSAALKAHFNENMSQMEAEKRNALLKLQETESRRIQTVANLKTANHQKRKLAESLKNAQCEIKKLNSHSDLLQDDIQKLKNALKKESFEANHLAKLGGNCAKEKHLLRTRTNRLQKELQSRLEATEQENNRMKCLLKESRYREQELTTRLDAVEAQKGKVAANLYDVKVARKELALRLDQSEVAKRRLEGELRKRTRRFEAGAEKFGLDKVELEAESRKLRLELQKSKADAADEGRMLSERVQNLVNERMNLKLALKDEETKVRKLTAILNNRVAEYAEKQRRAGGGGMPVC